MSAPSCAKRCAMARPIPWLPPVMATTFPAKRFPTMFSRLCSLDAMRSGWLSYMKIARSVARLRLFCRDQRGGTGNALPGLVLLYPRVDEPFAMDIRFSFFHALDTKNAGNDSGIAVDLNVDLLIHSLRRLILGCFDAGEKLSFSGDTAVDFDGDKSASEHHVERFGVLELDGVAPRGFKREDSAAFVAGRVLAECGNCGSDEQCHCDCKRLFHCVHGCTFAVADGSLLRVEQWGGGGRKSLPVLSQYAIGRKRRPSGRLSFGSIALTESKRPIWRSAFPATLRHGDFGAEVDVLNGVEEFYSFDHRTLERFAAGDEAGAAGAFVDDSGSDRFFEIVCAGCAAGVYETGATHVAIRDLVAAKIDGMIAG